MLLVMENDKLKNPIQIGLFCFKAVASKAYFITYGNQKWAQHKYFKYLLALYTVNLASKVTFGSLYFENTSKSARLALE
ncbi:MAG: hypothetical protein ACI93R_003823 [Flavobacteriales bacterium]